MFCKNCGNEMNEGAAFCRECGNAVSTNTTENNSPPEQEYTQTIFCKNCGTQNKYDSTFCKKCGAKITGNDTEQQTSYNYDSTANNSPPWQPYNQNMNIKIQPFQSEIILKVISGIVSIIILIFGIVFVVKMLNADTSEADGIFNDYINSNDKYVKMVKAGILNDYPNKTVGEAFDSFMGNARWESGISSEGQRFVNVKGSILYANERVEAAIQFLIDYDNGTFEYNACEFNGVPQTNFMFQALLGKIYE